VTGAENLKPKKDGAIMKSLRILAIAATLALAATWPLDAANVVVKLGTVVPDGSVWHKILRQMGADWRKATDGRVTLRVYAGGTQGTEAAMIKRMNFNQLQAASFSIIGLSEIDDAFSVFSIPLFYDSYDELNHVIEKLTPALDARLQARGFRRLNWGHGGWVYIFSKTPVRSIDEIRKLKLFTAAGDDRSVQWYKEHGFNPVPLAISDMMTSLQTGMIQAIPVTPLSALAFQWYQQTPNMLDIGLAPLVGATLITERAWSRIDAADQASMQAASSEAEAQLLAEIPEQDREALVEMKTRGLAVTVPADDTWRATAAEFARSRRGAFVPAEIYDQAVRERDAYRAAHGGSR
jgi:TRAP-type C4-dicarboxylate transport system substrate-binding protein